jgi:hypothetical protein
MIGVVAECGRKRLAIICSMEIDKKTGIAKYHGVGFDGKAWESVRPNVRAKNMNDYIENVLRFGKSGELASRYDDEAELSNDEDLNDI